MPEPLVAVSDSAPALLVRRFIQFNLLHQAPYTQSSETGGLPDDWTSQLYVAGRPVPLYRFNENADNKRVYTYDGGAVW